MYRGIREYISRVNKAGDPRKHEEYRTFRNKLGNIIKAQKQLYYTKKFEKNVSNKRATWKFINNLRGKSAVPLPSSFRINGKKIDNSLMIVNSFNKYFCSLAENLNKASTDDTMCHENPNITTYLPTSNKKSIFSRPTSFLQKSSCRVSSEKNILNSSVEWKNWIKVISLFTFSHIFCLLSILSYEARMIIDIHTCVIQKSQSLTCFLFININMVTRGAHDIRTCVLWEFLTLTYCVV